MRWGEQITLVALSEPSPRTNEHGFPVARTETATTVFADKKSVGFSALNYILCNLLLDTFYQYYFHFSIFYLNITKKADAENF